MAGINLPSKAVRTQIAAALDMIVQVSRMRDGMRRITHVMEVVGMEGDVITTQDLFVYEFEGEEADGKLHGNVPWSGLRPHFPPSAAYFGLDRPLLEAMVMDAFGFVARTGLFLISRGSGDRLSPSFSAARCCRRAAAMP